MNVESANILDRVNELMDEYRHQCLWFLRENFRATTTEQALRALGYIQRHGDREGYRKAGHLKQWLLHPSSETSVR